METKPEPKPQESLFRKALFILAPAIVESAVYAVILTFYDHREKLDALALRVLELETVLEAERSIDDGPVAPDAASPSEGA